MGKDSTLPPYGRRTSLCRGIEAKDNHGETAPARRLNASPPEKEKRRDRPIIHLTLGTPKSRRKVSGYSTGRTSTTSGT
jgi:hypothetical protein